MNGRLLLFKKATAQGLHAQVGRTVSFSKKEEPAASSPAQVEVSPSPPPPQRTQTSTKLPGPSPTSSVSPLTPRLPSGGLKRGFSAALLSNEKKGDEEAKSARE